MTAPHLAFGAAGESRAEAFLVAKGWEIRQRNFRCKGGELDLVAVKGDVLAFVEVKARGEDDGFQPTVAVSPAKIRRLVIAARTWLSKNEGGIDGLFPRFDVITVLGRDEQPLIEHLEDAFEAPGG